MFSSYREEINIVHRQAMSCFYYSHMEYRQSTAVIAQ